MINHALDILTNREKEVIMLRFGLKDGQQKTLEEIAEHLNSPRERIRQIEAKAVRRLHSKNIFLDEILKIEDENKINKLFKNSKNPDLCMKLFIKSCELCKQDILDCINAKMQEIYKKYDDELDDLACKINEIEENLKSSIIESDRKKYLKKLYSLKEDYKRTKSIRYGCTNTTAYAEAIKHDIESNIDIQWAVNVVFNDKDGTIEDIQLRPSINQCQPEFGHFGRTYFYGYLSGLAKDDVSCWWSLKKKVGNSVDLMSLVDDYVMHNQR